MNNLLLFFAIPVATIIFSIVLQKLIQSPLLVAATAFAVFLVVTFAAFDESFLVYVILYTLLALVTAIIVRFICCLIKNSNNPCINGNAFENQGMCGNSESTNNDSDDDNGSNSCGCRCNRNMTNQFFNRRYMMRR